MPTIARIGPYRFFFFSNERGEPPHVHVEREEAIAKFWLNPVRLASSSEFSARELRRLEPVVLENHTRFLEAWREFFGSEH
jgi:hypothetical protein